MEQTPPTWREWIGRKALGLLLADRAAGMARIQAAARATHNLARRTREGTLGQPEGEPIDDMGVRVGDDQITHYHAAPRQSWAPWLALAAIGLAAWWIGGPQLTAALGRWFAPPAAEAPADPSAAGSGHPLYPGIDRLEGAGRPKRGPDQDTRYTLELID